MTDAEIIQRVTAALQQIEAAIEDLTGLKSRWSGTVILDATLEALGTKPFNCDIILQQAMRLIMSKRKPALELLSKHKNTLDGKV